MYLKKKESKIHNVNDLSGKHNILEKIRLRFMEISFKDRASEILCSVLFYLG